MDGSGYRYAFWCMMCKSELLMHCVAVGHTVSGSIECPACGAKYKLLENNVDLTITVKP
jgi:transcription elongation factor Elf1